MSIYKLYGAGTGGTENSIASLDIQFEGHIIALWGTMFADLDTADENVNAEVSFLSTNTISSNDVRGSLIMLGLSTAGTTETSYTNSGLSGLMIPVNNGERMHLHIAASAGVVSFAHVYMYVEDGQPAELRRRR